MMNSNIAMKNLNKTLEIIFLENISSNDWFLMGDFALCFLMGHRVERDIVVGLSRMDLLSLLTPRLNERMENLVIDYAEGLNFVKLKFSDFELSFVVERRLTDFEPFKVHLFSNIIQVENPLEIVAKKVFYRGLLLKPLDLIDIAVVYGSYPELPEVLIKNKLIPKPKEIFFEVLDKSMNSLKKYNNRELKNCDIRMIENFIEKIKKRNECKK